MEKREGEVGEEEDDQTERDVKERKDEEKKAWLESIVSFCPFCLVRHPLCALSLCPLCLAQWLNRTNNLTAAG